MLTAVLAMGSMGLRATWHTVNHHYHSLINGAATKCNVSNEMCKGVKWTLCTLQTLCNGQETLPKPVYQQNTSGHITLIQSLGAFAQS
jgi:hypothetical protein